MSEEDIVWEDVFKSIRAITLSHNHVMMFVRIATDKLWFTFQGPYNKTDYNEIIDPSNSKTIFEMQFENMRFIGCGRLDGAPDIKLIGGRFEQINSGS